MSEWMPIETAPKDGTWIWVFIPGRWVPRTGNKKKKGPRKTLSRQVCVRWVDSPTYQPGRELTNHAKELAEKHGGYWSGQSTGQRPTTTLPTHWMPRPDDPPHNQTSSADDAR